MKTKYKDIISIIESLGFKEEVDTDVIDDNETENNECDNDCICCNATDFNIIRYSRLLKDPETDIVFVNEIFKLNIDLCSTGKAVLSMEYYDVSFGDIATSGDWETEIIKSVTVQNLFAGTIHNDPAEIQLLINLCFKDIISGKVKKLDYFSDFYGGSSELDDVSLILNDTTTLNDIQNKYAEYEASKSSNDNVTLDDLYGYNY